MLMAGEDFKKLEKIGSGSYGSVWIVKKSGVYDGNMVLKEISLRGMCEQDMNKALTEVEILARCKHENIIKYTHAFLTRQVDILSIVMEHASEGDLHKQITQRRGLFFPNETILRWFSQLVSALDYIHARHILHRDVKPQNLFLTSIGSLKLGDFGIAKLLASHMDKACTFIGTPFYLSPEICRQEPYSYASDMWSAGCVLYELCCLCVPFTASNMAALVVKIESAKYTPLPSHCCPVLDELVKSLLNSDPLQRPAAADIIKMEITQKNSNQELWRLCSQNKPFTVDKDRQRKLAKNGVDSTTYTVVKHPKALRPSLASPELSAMLCKQRTLSRDGHRAVASADNPPRPVRAQHRQKRSASPCFSLMEKECKRKRSPRLEVTETQGGEPDCDLQWDALSREVYRIYLSSRPNQHKAQAVELRLIKYFGGDRLQHLFTAVKDKTECEKLLEIHNISPKYLPVLLLCLELKKIVTLSV